MLPTHVAAVSLPCPDATKLLFWDSRHPTGAASSYLFKHLQRTMLI